MHSLQLAVISQKLLKICFSNFALRFLRVLSLCTRNSKLIDSFILSPAFTQLAVLITKENVNYVIMVKSLGNDCDSSKYNSLIITNSQYSPKGFRTTWPIFSRLYLLG